MDGVFRALWGYMGSRTAIIRETDSTRSFSAAIGILLLCVNGVTRGERSTEGWRGKGGGGRCPRYGGDKSCRDIFAHASNT